MQIKTTVSYQLTPVKVAIIKKDWKLDMWWKVYYCWECHLGSMNVEAVCPKIWIQTHTYSVLHFLIYTTQLHRQKLPLFRALYCVMSFIVKYQLNVYVYIYSLVFFTGLLFCQFNRFCTMRMFTRSGSKF